MCADAVRISVSGGFHVSGYRNKEIARRQVECWGSSAEASHPGPVAARSALGVWVVRGAERLKLCGRPVA